MRGNFSFLHYCALGTLTLALSGCYYVATPYGYVPYVAPTYPAYPVARYPAYPVQYVQPRVTHQPVTQSAPVSIPAPVGSVYFDINSDIIKPEYQSVVQAHAAYLREHPDVRVAVQGNADDRGAIGYNQSLGTRRAEAVKHALESYGVPATQISTVSFGDKNPASSDRNEAGYAKNRRVDFNYLQ